MFLQKEKNKLWDFHGSPVVKIQCFKFKGIRVDSLDQISWTRIQNAMQWGQKITKCYDNKEQEGRNVIILCIVLTIYMEGMHACSAMSNSATLCAIAHQTPLPMGLPRQEYWGGLPFLTPGDLLNPGMEPISPTSPALASRFITTEPPGNCIWEVT